uniref:Uncharacterized protein n=1 Tax=Sipha flava TaxID=143950 RepID=A0A2S2QS87_9HEMI
MCFLHSFIPLSKTGPYIFRRTFFSNIFGLNSTVFLSAYVTAPYRTIDFNNVMYILIFKILDKALDFNTSSNSFNLYLLYSGRHLCINLIILCYNQSQVFKL